MATDHREAAWRTIDRAASRHLDPSGSGIRTADAFRKARRQVLLLSQSLLLPDTQKANRPSFTDAAPAELPEPLYEQFCTALESTGVEVQRGVFGSPMAVEIVNHGPVTIILDIES